MLLISTLLDIYGLLCICITLFVHSIYFSLTLCQSCLEIYLILYLIMHIVSKILSEAVRLHRMLTRMRLLSSRKVSDCMMALPSSRSVIRSSCSELQSKEDTIGFTLENISSMKI